MAFSRSGHAPSEYRFSFWNVGVSRSAVLGAASSLLGGLAMFSCVSLLTDPTSITTANSNNLLLAMVGLIAFLIADVWFSVAVVGFGYRASQFIEGRGAQLKYRPWWMIAGWVIPLASIFMPYLVLRDIAGFGITDPAVAAARKRSVLWFWIWWTGLSYVVSWALQDVTSNSAPLQFDGWRIFAGAMAFYVVPFMMGRKLFAQLNADLREAAGLVS